MNLVVVLFFLDYFLHTHCLNSRHLLLEHRDGKSSRCLVNMKELKQDL